MVQEGRDQAQERIDPALSLEHGEDLLARDRRKGHRVPRQFACEFVDQGAGRVLMAESLDQECALFLVQLALPLHPRQVLFLVDERRGPASGVKPEVLDVDPCLRETEVGPVLAASPASRCRARSPPRTRRARR